MALEGRSVRETLSEHLQTIVPMAALVATLGSLVVVIVLA